METEVINYIKEAQKHGLSEVEIKQNLLNAGWEAGVVEDSFMHLKAAETKAETVSSSRPEVQKPISSNSPFSANLNTPMTGPTVQTSAPGTNISEEHFLTSAQPTSSKKPFLWITLLIILVLGAGGYLYYAYGYSNPTKTWEKFTVAKKNPIYKSNFQASFFDVNNRQNEADNDSPLSSIKDIKLSFDGNFYIDSTDSKNPQSSSNVKYTFSMGNTSFSTGFEYKFINKILYLNAGDNPFISGVVGSLSPNEKIEWLSLDFNKLEEESNKQSAEDVKKLNEIFNPSFKEELQKIWEDARFVTVEKYIGREKVNDKGTLHFKNTLDKQVIKDTLNTIVEKIYTAFKEKEAKLEDKDLNIAKLVINSLVDKIEVKEFETWIGQSDFRLYKVHFVSNAPSVFSLVNDAVGGARSNSRDAKRLADIRQMASGLELYYNDNNGYPDGKDGLPLDITPTYLGVIPTAPIPADGGCTDYYNPYWYQPTGKKTTVKGKNYYESYELTFCLGQGIGGYKAGIAKLSPQGIEDNITCPSTPENCGTVSSPLPALTDEQKVQEVIDKLAFSAEFKIDSDYSDYGKTESLQAPEKFFDLMKVLNGAVQGAFTNIGDSK